MAIVRRNRSNPKTPTSNGTIILEELSKRATTLTAWLADYGLNPKYQRTASDIIYGKILGKNNTKTQGGGTVRALMLALHFEFGVTWDWMSIATNDEIAAYRRLLVKMSNGAVINERGHRAIYVDKDAKKALFKKVQLFVISESRLVIEGSETRRPGRIVRVFRTCVRHEMCPLCLGNAEYASVRMKINNRTGELTRSKSVLTCQNENGQCNNGNQIEKNDMFSLLVEKYSARQSHV